MSRFDRAVEYVLSQEGGDSNHPDDPGGRTRFGITEKTARRHRLDIRKLTRENAIHIYRLDYWLHAYDDIKDEALAIKVFDFGVNAGTERSNRYLQKSATDLGAKLKIDGILGPISLDAINRMDPDVLLRRFAWRVWDDHYAAIVDKHESQAVFLNGWRNRLSEVPIVTEGQRDA